MACPYGTVEMRVDGVVLYRAKSWQRARRSRPPPPAPPPPPPAVVESPLVAVGVLSTIQSFGCKAVQGRMHCRTTHERATSRRARLRSEYLSSRVAPSSVALRFLIAGMCSPPMLCPPREPYMPAPKRVALDAAQHEALAHGDMIFLNTTEDQLGGCSLKYLLWLEVALERFPNLGFVGERGPFRGSATTESCPCPHTFLCTLASPHCSLLTFGVPPRTVTTPTPTPTPRHNLSRLDGSPPCILHPHLASFAFAALADDDEYIHFPHLHAELLRVVRTERRSHEELVYWGSIFWRPYYNHVTMNSAEILHLDIERDLDDGQASKDRYKLERCRRSISLARSTARSNSMGASKLKYCSPRKLPTSRRLEMEQGQVSLLPPTPMANGALFAVSRSLALLLAAPNAVPRRWLHEFKRTQLIRFARSRRRLPYKLKEAGCWPNGDATFGVWVQLLASELRPSQKTHGSSRYVNSTITLIDMPIWVSSHPEALLDPERAFGNSSIVLHGLKDARTDAFWPFAQKRGAGPYVPPSPRRCDTCRRMGWATWPGSQAKAWRCCGAKVRRRAIRLDPRSVFEGMNSSAWWEEERALALRARVEENGMDGS